MPILTGIDTTGIQNYIFGSNKLRESIGASEIIRLATSDWVKECLFEDRKTNICKQTSDFLELELTKDSLDAELIYAGGGNTFILFKDRDTAFEFTKIYTKYLLKNAPGLSVIVAHSDEFNLEGNISKKHGEVLARINDKKADRKLSSPLLGMAVTSKCISTGGVASFDPVEANNTKELSLRDKYGYNYVSAETFAKLKYFEKANQRLQKELCSNSSFQDLMKDLEIPYDFDHLGRTEGEDSYIAVVHTDGNGMGKRIKDVADKAKTDREWIEEMRSFSKKIHDANISALKATLSHLLSNIKEDKKDKNKIVDGGHGECFELKRISNSNNFYLPLRPLVFGGDDATFVCDGRIGLALAAYYLETVEKEILSDKKGLYSRAGVAIVKSHHPFARAYALAEDLAKSAKSRINEVNEHKNDDNKIMLSAIDWHLAMTGLAGNIEEIREREYKTKQGNSLNMRPLSLSTNTRDTESWKSYQSFKNVVKSFLQPEWREKRNKVKALRDALRNGEDAVKNFISLYRVESQRPEVKNHKNQIVGENGWEQDICLWFDAIEMLDLFYPLEQFDDTRNEDRTDEIPGAANQT